MKYYINGQEVNKFKLDMVLYDLLEELYSEDFDEMIDETHEEIKLLGITYDASFLLKQSDPIAYEIAQQEYISFLYEEIMEEFQNNDILTVGNYTFEFK